MRTKGIIITLFLCLGLNSWGGHEVGGVDEFEVVKSQIRLLLTTDKLKQSLINYIDTVDLTAIDASSPEGLIVKNMFIRAKLEPAFRQDILTVQNYRVGVPCFDSQGLRVPASTVIGELNAPICFDVDELASLYRTMEPEQVLLNLASVAIHEHLHHLQDSNLGREVNENEAHLLTAYFRLSAKVRQVPVIEWSPTEGQQEWTHPCERSYPVVGFLEFYTKKRCHKITPWDLAHLTIDNKWPEPSPFELFIDSSTRGDSIALGDMDGLTSITSLSVSMHVKPGEQDHLPIGYLKPLVSLTHLFYSTIGDIFLEELKDVPQLKGLGLRAVRFPDEILNGLRSLEDFFLSTTADKVPEGFFNQNPRLRFVEIEAPVMSFVSPKIFLNNVELHNLSIKCKCDSLPEIGHLKQLETFLFDSSLKLVKYPKGYFRGLHQLKEIRMTSIAPNGIPKGLFRNLENLKKVFILFYSEKQLDELRAQYPNIEFSTR